MKVQDKTLLIHEDTKTHQTTTHVVDEKDVLTKTKELLKELKAHKKAEVNIYEPVGVVLKPAEGDAQESYAVAYEREQLIVVAPNGTHEEAKAYGNWEEAINCAKRLLTTGKSTTLILTQYKGVTL